LPNTGTQGSSTTNTETLLEEGQEFEFDVLPTPEPETGFNFGSLLGSIGNIFSNFGLKNFVFLLIIVAIILFVLFLIAKKRKKEQNQ